MHTSIIDTVSQSELWQVHVFSIVYYRGVLYYAELNYAEKGIKAKLRRFFFLPYKTPNMLNYAELLNYAEVLMFRAKTPK